MASGSAKRALLFAIGFVVGALLFLIGGVSSPPTPPKCPGCAVLSPSVHDPDCNVAVQGGWTCEDH
jgi:hypothetical protein